MENPVPQNSAATAAVAPVLTPSSVAGNEPRGSDGLLVPLSDVILVELRTSLSEMGKANLHKPRGSLELIMKDAEQFKETLQARVSQYDAALKRLDDGDNRLSRAQSDSLTKLEELRVACETRTEEYQLAERSIVNLRADENSIRKKLDSSRASLQWVNTQVQAAEKEEQMVRDLTRRLREQEQNVKRDLDSIAEKQK